MEFKQIKELATLIDSTDIVELEIKKEGFQIRIRKEDKSEVPVQIAESVATAPIVSAMSAAPTSSATGELSAEPEKDSGYIEVVAPMVGTFYRAPAPDAAPYVQVGDSISDGQTLFIIEAMKMMNEVESEVKGVVKEVLVENGQAVEFGQPLLLIDPKD